MGYDLARSNFNDENYDRLGNGVMDVILVKKSYSDRKRKNRNWKLKHLDKDQGDLVLRKQDQERIE